MRRREWVVIFLGTVLVVYLFWAVVPGGWNDEEGINTDYRAFYAPVAQNLLDGRGLATPDGKPAVQYPPGYPLILAGLFGLAKWTGTSEVLWLKVFTLLAMGLAAVSLYGLARMVLGDRTALVTAALWMTYPFNLWLAKTPNSEIPFLPLFYGALFIFGGVLWRGWTRHWVALSAGLLVGCAALVRPIALLVGVLLAGFMMALRGRKQRKRWILLASALLLGNIGILIPWEIWAFQRTGEWIPLSTGGVWSMQDGLSSAITTKGYRRVLEVPTQVREVMQAAVQQQGGMRTGGAVLKFLAKMMTENPSGVLRLLGWKMARAWYGTDAQRENEEWIIRIQIGYLLLVIGGSYLLWHEGSGGRQWVGLVGVLILYFWAMTITVLSILRYMVPVIGLLFPAGAVVLVKALGELKIRLCSKVT